jgi:hypothetical protein
MFEISIPIDGKDESCEHESIGGPTGSNMIQPVKTGGPFVTFLPRRSGQSRFGPRQYYYPASRTGVVPSSRFAA